MAYEVRVEGGEGVRFETEQEAIEAAKKILAENPDAGPEVIDLSTGEGAAPGASKGSREELRNKIGF